MTKGNDAITGQPVMDERGGYVGQAGGLTKREYFAAMAMQGILAHPNTPSEVSFRDVTLQAVTMADVLIEELNK